MDLPELQQAIRDVPGVATASMRWPNPEGPVRVQVTFAEGADRAAVTASLLELVKESGAADPDTVDVAGRPQRDRMAEGRPVFLGLNVDSGSLESNVEVVLDIAGTRTAGRAQGLPVPASEIRTAAVATLQALQGTLPEHVRFELDWLDVGRAGGGEPAPLVHAGITCLAPGFTPQRLFGSAQVRSDVRIAAARATLDALNRRLVQLARAS